MLNISLQQKMMMKLSPQQVQYLKMLQLPTLALEQKIKAELEVNPLLEEIVTKCRCHRSDILSASTIYLKKSEHNIV